MKHLPLSSYHDFLKYSRKREGSVGAEMQALFEQFGQRPFVHDLFPSVFYMVDYMAHSYHFQLINTDSFIGYPAAFFLNTSPSFLNRIRKQDDFNIFNEQIFPDEMHFLQSNKVDNGAEYAFITNFRIKNFNDNWSVVLQRTRYIFNNYDDLPVASVNSLMDITDFKNDSKINLLIERCDNNRRQCVVQNKFYYSRDDNDILSKREVDVLKLASKGLGSKEIAEKLNISIHTINNHRRNMLVKSNCRNILQLIDKAIKNGTI